jgi:hypothetical protein
MRRVESDITRSKPVMLKSGSHHVLHRQRIYIHTNTYKVVDRDEARKNRTERSNDYHGIHFDANYSVTTP